MSGLHKSAMMMIYEKSTGKPSTRFVTDGIHSVGSIEVWHYDYVKWLEDVTFECRYKEQKVSLKVWISTVLTTIVWVGVLLYTTLYKNFTSLQFIMSFIVVTILVGCGAYVTFKERYNDNTRVLERKPHNGHK